MHIPTPDEIRARREFLGMKQAELAQKAGISQSMVARIESGSVDPRASTLGKIVQVLNAVSRPRITASQVMHAPVYSVEPEDSISRAVEIMEKNGISQLPVLADGVPVGCISESAIMDVIGEQSTHGSHRELVRNFMESSFPSVPPDISIETVVHLLQQHHAVLVMETGKVRGVITRHDLISLIVNR